MTSLVTAFGLAGFLAGIVFYIFLFWIVLQRKNRRKLEIALLFLMGGLLLWYAGNFITLLLRQMDISRISTLLGIVDSIAFSGLAVLPALLVHTHWLYYDRYFQPTAREKRLIFGVLAALYVPLVLLPVAVALLFPASHANPIDKLGSFTFPFLALLGISYYASFGIDLRILKQSSNTVERSVFKRLAVIFFIIPLFNFYVFWPVQGQAPAVHQFWVVLASLASVLPSVVVAYYIYHYQFLHLAVHRGITTVFLLLITLSSYLFGVRRLVSYLEGELDAPPFLVEAVLLSVILLLFAPISRWIGAQTEDLFSGEMRRHRQLAESINRKAPQLLDSSLLVEFIEETLERELPAEKVRISLGEFVPDIDSDGMLLPLKTAGTNVGFIGIHRPANQTGPAERETFHLLATEIAFALERSRLVESKLALEKEISSKSQLEELGRMAASVAHTVKNPLSSIKTLMQLLMEADNLSEDQRHEVSMMIAEVNRLSKTITNLLKYSQPDEVTGKLQPLARPVNLVHLLDSVKSVFGGDLQTRQVSLELNLDLESPVVQSDADALVDILSNLISNAIEVTPAGGSILVSLQKEDSTVVLTVEDPGPGIPEAIRKRVFKPFFTTKTKGTGLGLAIVEKRVQQLKGTVALTSPVSDHGTRFTVRFPDTTLEM